MGVGHSGPAQPSRAITKEGSAALRLAFTRSATAPAAPIRSWPSSDHRLRAKRGHCHTQATIAVARKLGERPWLVLATGRPYELRGPDGQPITQRAANALIAERYTVDPAIRARARAHPAATHRDKLTR